MNKLINHLKLAYVNLKGNFQGSGLKLSAEMAQYIARWVLDD